MLFMTGTTGKCFNYSDCSEPEEPKLPMWWFAKKQEDSSLLFNELRLLKKGAYANKFEERRLLPIIMGFINPEQVKEVMVGRRRYTGSAHTHRLDLLEYG